MRKHLSYLFLMSLIFASEVQADVLGVSDAALLAKVAEELSQLKKEYKLLSETYDNAKTQLSELKKLKEINTGNYGFGNLANSFEDLKNRQWSPNTWDEALQNISGGNPIRYQELIKAYQKSHPTLDDQSFLKGASNERLTQYQQNKAVNQAISVQATYAYNEINNHLKAIHALSANIEKTANTKSAIDLNSRLIAELAYIQTENLKLQTLLSQQASSNNANDIALDSETAKFNRLPDE
ncbi:type IV secretion system protein [Legionella micdadei]|uniref:type IV secretion system protein n=1 Tax=Legionella micdadei TaxID=451 RepID=UPI0020C6126A|nr:type IV secretion system protein [Legionella micdadei]